MGGSRGVSKMATLSEVKWCQTVEKGKCPNCGRTKPLGKVNLLYEGAEIEKCIDCHFGPPLDMWIQCRKCNEYYPGGTCDCGEENP